MEQYGIEVTRLVGWDDVSEVSTENTIIIVDEADHFFIDEVKSLPRKYKSCIAFTATIPQNSQESGFIKERLDNLNFTLMKNLGYDDSLNYTTVQIATLNDFFSQSRRTGKLIFCRSDEVDSVKSAARNHREDTVSQDSSRTDYCVAQCPLPKD